MQTYALRAIGAAYIELGEYSKALDYQNRSVKIMQAIDPHVAGATLGNIGIIYQHLGDYKKAKQYYEQSLNSARKYNDSSEQERNLDNLGDLYLQIGDYDKALRYLQEALRIANVIDEGNGSFRPSILLNLGNVYQQNGQYQKALEYTRLALEAAKAREMRLVEGGALNTLADIYFETGQISEAEERFKEALALGEQTGISRVIWRAHRGLGQVLEAEGKYPEAEGHYKAAIDVIETVRSQIQRPEDKSTFLGRHVTVYERMISLLFRLHRREPTKGYDREAFHYAERGRARAFLDTLAESKAGVRKGLSAEQLKRQTAILNEISNASSALLSEKPEAEKKQWQAELKKAEDKLAEFSSEIRATNLEYAALKYPEPYDAEKVQSQVLSGDTVLIEYALGDEQSYVWMLTKDQLKMETLPKRSKIEKQVTRYRKMITVRPKGKKAFHEYYSQARLLYKMLLGPIQEHLAKGRTLIIVPDGILYYLPFETLVKQTAAGRKNDLQTPSPVADSPRRIADPTGWMWRKLQTAYLIEDHVISYAPSASLLGDLMAMRPMVKPSHDKKMELLAYGDPVFSPGQKTAGATRRNSDKSRLAEIVRGIYEGTGIKFSPLPNTREEVENIAALYPAKKRKIYLENRATESSIKREKLSAYKRLHFATHAIIDEQIPTRSGIVLSLVNTGEEDGILQMNEIFNLELAADLVVLSACQTGLGKMVRGEGVVGLTRAFLYAGASSVAVSLWEVNDLSTSEFMEAFYKKMKEGKRKGRALREAKLEMIHSDVPAYQHPYFWAPFVLIGAM